MNVPYVVEYDENGVVSNPINGRYRSTSPNRRQRRQKLKPRTNGGRVQVINLKDPKTGELNGKTKVIKHRYSYL